MGNARRLTPDGRREMLSVVKAFYDAALAEPTPKCVDELVKKLK